LQYCLWVCLILYPWLNTLLVHAKFAIHICTNLTIHLIAAKKLKKLWKHLMMQNSQYLQNLAINFSVKKISFKINKQIDK
jgi:hypothetical protein